MIGLVGAADSGKTVLMTVLVKHLREIVGRRFQADIRLANERPDGFEGLDAYYQVREDALFEGKALPRPTAAQATTRLPPIVLRWRQERTVAYRRRIDSILLSLVDTAGEDLSELEAAFTLRYLQVVDSLIVVLDPFRLPKARSLAGLPKGEAERSSGDVPIDVLTRVTEVLRTEKQVKGNRKIQIPVAVVFTKIDAFYKSMDRHNPIMEEMSTTPAYDDSLGLTIHEHVLALMRDWGAEDIDRHMQLNYKEYRYFAISALGAEPIYSENRVAGGGVRPHRVEDPLLWLLNKAGMVAAK